MVRRNTRRLNRRRQRKQRGGTGGISSGYYKTLVPVDVHNALGFSGRIGVTGCSAPAVNVFNGNSLDQAFLSASGVAPSQGGGRKTRKVRKSRKTRKVRKSRKTRKVRKSRKVRKTKRKQRGGAVSMIVPLAVVGGGYYLWNRYNQPTYAPLEDNYSFSPLEKKRDIRGPPSSLSKLKGAYTKWMHNDADDVDDSRVLRQVPASIQRGHY